MPVNPTEFPGLMIFEPKVFEDSRGYFFESYNARTFNEAGITIEFVQDNQAKSAYGVLRGLHYQVQPFAQTKLIRVLSGAILDVAVDMRKGSPTFGRHFSIELSAANRRQLLIPQGFAHGYSVLSSEAEVLYKCDRFYHKDSEAGIRFDDPALGIEWRIPLADIIVSEKDTLHPAFADAVNNFQFEH
jgi:dTDP-4-dehydrorhamnose 3,5-epimerase